MWYRDWGGEQAGPRLVRQEYDCGRVMWERAPTFSSGVVWVFWVIFV